VKNIDIILNPEFSEKIGYGHLKRIITLYKILQKKYRCAIACIHEKHKKIDISEPLNILNFSSKDEFLIHLKRKKPKIVILDYRYYKKNFIAELSKLVPLIVIDSPTQFKSANPLLYLNILTPLKFKKFSESQLFYSGLPYYPVEKTLIKFRSRKSKNYILVSFGNSDPNNLTLKTLKKLNKIKKLPYIKITIGKFFNKKNVKKITEFLKTRFIHPSEIIFSPDNIHKLIAESRCLITSFSLTFIEGLIFNKKVALYNNSKYHAKLAQNFEQYFVPLGIFPFPLSLKSLKRFNKKKQKIYFNEIDFRKNNQRILKLVYNFLKLKAQESERKCRICGKSVYPVLNQFERKIYECKSCKVKYLTLDKKTKAEEIYKKEYFTEEYKRQYGVTYLEDRENILKLADARLKIILKYISPANKKLLDIGCAYGFFLEKAREKGFDVCGIEIEKKAARYAKQNLKLNVMNKNFLNAKLNQKFDVITMWYVLEHFVNPEKVLIKIMQFLNPDGMICISLPNGNGAFYRFNKNKWLSIHPDAHFFDYSIKSLKILFKKYGLELKQKRITGIHPERIGIKNKILQKIVIPFFKLLNLGDTMELYFKYIS